MLNRDNRKKSECPFAVVELPTTSSDALPLRVIRVSYGLSVPVFMVSEGRWSTSAKEHSDFFRVSPIHNRNKKDISSNFTSSLFKLESERIFFT